MRTYILILFLLFPILIFAQEEVKPEESFDFWIGEWDITWTDNVGNPGNGISSVKKIFEGTVIEEEFVALVGRSKGYKGKSLTLHQAQRGRWKQAWIDNQFGFLDLTGTRNNDRIVLTTELSTTPDGRKTIHRVTFSDIKMDSFDWFWEFSTDGGISWDPIWKLKYSRKKD